MRGAIIGALHGRGAGTQLRRALFAAGLTIALAGCAAQRASEQPERARPDTALPATAPAAAEPSDPAALMMRSATAMLGQPYRFGGAAPGGFDCSGLVLYSAHSAGIFLPRTAHEQLHAGVPVARGAVEPGDLVFMRLAHKDLHVGIAIDGRRFIHAPATGGRVRIDSLDAPPYSTGFVSARRVAP